MQIAVLSLVLVLSINCITLERSFCNMFVMLQSRAHQPNGVFTTRVCNNDGTQDKFVFTSPYRAARWMTEVHFSPVYPIIYSCCLKKIVFTTIQTQLMQYLVAYVLFLVCLVEEACRLKLSSQQESMSWTNRSLSFEIIF